jgi:hypothetical protein
VAAAIAVVSGERDPMATTPVPNRIRDVSEASPARVANASLEAISGTNAAS